MAQSAYLIFGLFILFFMMNVPVVVALGGASLATILSYNIVPLIMVPQRMYGALDSWTLLAIPFFVLAGTIMGKTSISERLITFAKVIVWKLPGGLGIVTVLTAILFAAISGSGPATVAALGALLVPSLVSNGYSRSFSSALVASSGGIGIIIPPSIALIIYGVLAETSVSKLFIAGIIPGIVVGIALISVVLLTGIKRASKPEKPKIKFGKAFLRAFPGLLTPIIILGGIYSGVFTPTESAAVAVIYSLFVSLVLYRELNLKSLFTIFRQAVVTSSVIMILVAAASVYSLVLTTEGIASGLAESMLSITNSKYALLLIINIVLLIAGCFTDAISIYYIFIPIFLPVIKELNINPIHFGILMTVNLAIGQITPPIGVNLYASSSVSGVPVKEVIKGVWWLLAAELAALALITYIPQLSLMFI
ncbi:MAG: C4-dicarboxylate ABC transporter permease [Chlamydiae bacterium]|nr:MAG: C4-dicarboxylate ABC transporter permease [Chlamydiota bacterium]